MRKYLQLLGLFAVAIFTCILTGCHEEKLSPKDIAINHVISRIVQDINSLNIGNPIYLIGTGGSIDHNTGKESTIRITFEINLPLSKEACRWLIVNIAQLFLVNIMKDQDLQQYLPEEGFKYKKHWNWNWLINSGTFFFISPRYYICFFTSWHHFLCYK